MPPLAGAVGRDSEALRVPDIPVGVRNPPRLGRALKRLLRRPYYGFWRAVEASLYRGREYALAVPSGRLVYMPWFSGADQQFDRIMDVVRRGGLVTVTPDRCYMLYQLGRYAQAVPGDMAECGTFKGGTAHLLAHVVGPGRRLHLFDTFTGMPAFVRPERDHHQPGDFGKTSLGYVQRRLAAFDFVEFHAGVIPATLAEVRDVGAYAFVHLDVDIYPTMLECCQWFWPRLSVGGVMVFDDYGYRVYRQAARKAVDEYCATVGIHPIVLPTGQAMVIKPPCYLSSQAPSPPPPPCALTNQGALVGPTLASIGGMGAGVPLKVASGRLGHSSIGITGDLYQHVARDMDVGATERAARALRGV